MRARGGHLALGRGGAVQALVAEPLKQTVASPREANGTTVFFTLAL